MALRDRFCAAVLPLLMSGNLLSGAPPSRSGAEQPRTPPAPVVRSAELVRLVFQIPDGETWATVAAINSIGDDKIAWQSGLASGSTSTAAKLFAEELQRAGFKTPSTTSLFGDAEGADFKVGALVTYLRGQYRQALGMIVSADHVRGSVSMSVEWQVYSPLERKVVATIRTNGRFEGKDYSPSFLPPIYGAFRENVRSLLNNGAFRALVSTPLVAEGASRSTLANDAPIRLITEPQTGRSLAVAARSVASVFTTDGMGSAFLISRDGLLMTNQHVTGSSRYVKVKWSSGFEVTGEVVRSDARRDVALIKVDSGSLQPLSLRRSSVELGEPVFAVGTPLDESLEGTITKGIVSANRVYNGLNYIQSDVAVTHGSSGGPLLDETGAVVGITVAIRTIAGAPTGFNFFIPIVDALKSLSIAVDGAETPPSPRASDGLAAGFRDLRWGDPVPAGMRSIGNNMYVRESDPLKHGPIELKGIIYFFEENRLTTVSLVPVTRSASELESLLSRHYGAPSTELTSFGKLFWTSAEATVSFDWTEEIDGGWLVFLSPPWEGRSLPTAVSPPKR